MALLASDLESTGPRFLLHALGELLPALLAPPPALDVLRENVLETLGHPAQGAPTHPQQPLQQPRVPAPPHAAAPPQSPRRRTAPAELPEVPAWEAPPLPPVCAVSAWDTPQPTPRAGYTPPATPPAAAPPRPPGHWCQLSDANWRRGRRREVGGSPWLAKC